MKDRGFSKQFNINLRGDLIDLSTPKVMGVLNLTPDSFYDGGAHNELELAMRQVEKMIASGVDIIDVGGHSTKPMAEPVSEEEELKRVVGVIQQIRLRFPNLYISVDTFRACVAQKAVELGADIINDVSAGKLDPKMIPYVLENKIPYIAMHMRGTPSTMMQLNQYEDVVLDVVKELSQITQQFKMNGHHQLILDPGFGFAKDLQQNYKLLNGLEQLHLLDCPILVGVSRKSMIYKLLDIQPDQALNGTTAINTIALLKGASILRVHDVEEAVQVVKIVEAMRSNH